MVFPELDRVSKTQRVIPSNELLCEICFIKHQNQQFIVTVHESWFDIGTGDDKIH
jgi:hypothetical protein